MKLETETVERSKKTPEITPYAINEMQIFEIITLMTVFFFVGILYLSTFLFKFNSIK